MPYKHRKQDTCEFTTDIFNMSKTRIAQDKFLLRGYENKLTLPDEFGIYTKICFGQLLEMYQKRYHGIYSCPLVFY